ncbi:uncharacterized protein GGS22DRAFT_193906 [Annulohypoxylon maeteangense]|uniref:uncharacterized protein n=1 Tax=Annulohypoxylon maeteangense TaxID=1927788 RepID=UPI0020085121|nr:uncharacterized protein GGS22DRAFT_193906 [Annulohypoxylon maeteangense]KAI0879793.1 hypothetical protein GGS22DRAFT_193906 [Annulohypoxylon maeteangense]
MSSRSTSYVPTSSSMAVAVSHEDYRSSKASDYKVDIHHRNNGRSVSIYNHHSSGYDNTAPHPDYRASTARTDSRKPPSQS